MFARVEKAKPDTGNIIALNLAVVKHVTLQVTRLLQQELLVIEHDLLN
jgi:hypothetical protein